MKKLLNAFLAGCLIYACSSMLTPSAIDSNSEKANLSKVRKTLIEQAEKYVGSKYKYGGTTPKGFDCSGFTSFIYNKIGIDLPRSSMGQSQKGKKITLGAALPGDLLFFKGTGKVSHVSMVVANDGDKIEVIHSTTSRGVIREDIGKSTYWQKKLLFGRRMMEE